MSGRKEIEDLDRYIRRVRAGRQHILWIGGGMPEPVSAAPALRTQNAVIRAELGRTK